MFTLADIREVLVTTGRMLIFQPTRPDLRRLGPLYIAAALLFSLLAGVGRYWDNPAAEWWQYAGLGSVVYIFLLAAVLYVLILPLWPQNWSYLNVLVFLGLTAPLAFFYAIPVERFLTMGQAQVVNVWFLGIVALWRMALLLNFLNTATRLPVHCVIIGTFIPIALIVYILYLMNLEHAVVVFMAGLREPVPPPTPNDRAYLLTLFLAVLAYLGAIPLAIAYIGAIVQRTLAATKERRRLAATTEE